MSDYDPLYFAMPLSKSGKEFWFYNIILSMYILIITGHVWKIKDLDRLYATNSIYMGHLLYFYTTMPMLYT